MKTATENIQLVSVWRELLSQFTQNEALINTTWQEIEAAYTQPNRHYHNLKHISDIVALIEKHREEINNVNALLFAAFYHDIIYKATRKDNEERSAEFAKQRLEALQVNEETIKIALQAILDTQAHNLSDNQDINLFLDYDLAILAAPADVYDLYTKNIRKEFAIFPDFLYLMGRADILHNFLDRDEIFFSEPFKPKEAAARANLQRELKAME